MGKITKKPKRVTVKWVENTYTRSKYTCPSCKGNFEGFVNKNTTRFVCSCGQELIVGR